MEANFVFENTLTEALARKREALNARELPQLREQFKLFQTSFRGMYDLFMKKGLVHEDPYKKDLKISEVSNPPERAFTDAEKIEQMSIRLSAYDAQLEFLNNYYQFSVDFLDMGRIKRILSLTKYINWQQLNDHDAGLNTRTVLDFINAIRKGNDSLASGFVNDSAAILERTSHAIYAYLKEATAYHKESYKLEIRKKVMPLVVLNKEAVFTEMDNSIKTIKRSFALQMGESPFYTELIQEILNEEYAGNGETLREGLLKTLAVKEEKKTAQKKEVSFRSILMEGIRILASINLLLDDALRKLSENSVALRNKRVTVWSRFRDWVRGKFDSQINEIFYEVEYFDPISSTTKRETLNFTVFIEKALQKTRLLASLSIKTSQAFRKLESASEDQLFSFLTKNFEELQQMNRRLAALDTYFKNEIPEEEREKIKGIKVELLSIKDTLIRANQKKHEYVAEKEELEQMRKLGIRTDVT